MDGYTYIQKVLEKDHHNLDLLLKKLKKRENSAVEFKASFIPKPNSDDDADGCSWNVISGIIAIANSAGGCILLGVNDDGEYAEGFHEGKSLDEYKRGLNSHIREKESWSFEVDSSSANEDTKKHKKFTFDKVCRKRLSDCVEIQEGKLNEKDILVVVIKPTKKIITYKEIKPGEHIAREYIAYRTKDAVASKGQVPFSAEELDRFENREKDSDYFEQLWSDYLDGKQEVDHERRFCVALSTIAILMTLLQIVLIYTDSVAGTTAKGFDLKFLFLLASLPFFAIVELFIFFVMKANRKLLLCDLVLCGSSFSIAAFTYVLKLFNVGNDNTPYSLGVRIAIALALFLGIFIYFFFFMPILTPCKHSKGNSQSPLPKPDEIDIAHPHLTWEWKCVDGGFWWENSDSVETPYGLWEFQRHKIFGNFRLLDPRAIMRCYGTRKEVLVEFNKVKKIYQGE